MQITNNKMIKIALSIFLVLTLTSMVYAFGVSSPYWETNPLTMAAGETKIIDLNLQNMVGEEDVNVKVSLKEGSEIASLSEEIYTVEAQTSDTLVPLRIRIPREKANDSYKIVAEVRTVTPKGGSGALVLGTGMTVSFDVLVSGEIERNYWPVIIITACILAILILIMVFLRKKGEKSKKK